MNRYYINKNKLRDKAIEWQHKTSSYNYSYGDLIYFSNYFEKKAKKYGLLKEFRENAII